MTPLSSPLPPRAPMQRHARYRKALPLQARWRNKCAELLACLGIDVVSRPVVPTAILQLREDRGDHEGISCYLSTERHNCDPAQARVPGSVPLFFYLEASSARYILRSTVKELRELLPVQSEAFLEFPKLRARRDRGTPQSPRLFLGGCEQYVVIDCACLHPVVQILFSIATTTSMAGIQNMPVAILQITKTGTGN